MKKIKAFFEEIKKEAKRVRWPKKKELLKSSLATICCVAILGLFFEGLDILFSTIMRIGG